MTLRILPSITWTLTALCNWGAEVWSIVSRFRVSEGVLSDHRWLLRISSANQAKILQSDSRHKHQVLIKILIIELDIPIRQDVSLCMCEFSLIWIVFWSIEFVILKPWNLGPSGIKIKAMTLLSIVPIVGLVEILHVLVGELKRIPTHCVQILCYEVPDFIVRRFNIAWWRDVHQLNLVFVIEILTMLYLHKQEPKKTEMNGVYPYEDIILITGSD